MQQQLSCVCLAYGMQECDALNCVYRQFYNIDGLTEEQLQIEEEKTQEYGNGCEICFTDDRDGELSYCRHRICRDCLTQYAIQYNRNYLRCPYCKQDVIAFNLPLVPIPQHQMNPDEQQQQDMDDALVAQFEQSIAGQVLTDEEYHQRRAEFMQQQQ